MSESRANKRSDGEAVRSPRRITYAESGGKAAAERARREPPEVRRVAATTTPNYSETDHLLEETAADVIRRDARYLKKEGISRAQAIGEIGIAAAGNKEWRWVRFPDKKEDTSEEEVGTQLKLHGETAFDEGWKATYVALPEEEVPHD